MADHDLPVAALGNWPGFRVTGVNRLEMVPPEICIKTRKVHEKSVREIRDLPLFDARTYLQVAVYRVWCDSCNGPKGMQVDWLDEPAGD